jgi:hypothetical protein
MASGGFASKDRRVRHGMRARLNRHMIAGRNLAGGAGLAKIMAEYGQQEGSARKPRAALRPFSSLAPPIFGA